MEEEGVCALFIGFEATQRNVTRVDLLLLPGQSKDFEGMLWRCGHPPTGLFSVVFGCDVLPSLTALDKVRVVCGEVSIGSRKVLSLTSISLLRPWRQVVVDVELKQQLSTVEHVFFLSSLSAYQVKSVSKGVVRCALQGHKGVINLTVKHVQLLHPGLAKGKYEPTRFLEVHRVPFHVLVVANEVKAIKWDIRNYLREHGMRLSTIKHLLVGNQDRVLIPRDYIEWLSLHLSVQGMSRATETGRQGSQN